MTILVVCSLRIEHRFLSEFERLPGVEVHLTGMGRARASAWADQWIVTGQRAVVSTGFCGALDPTLPRGALVAAHTVVDALDGARFAADPGLLDAAGPTGRGTLVSTTSLLRTPQDRAATAGTVVDMESAALARVAAARGVPFLAIRSVTDRANDSLPDLERVVDGLGRPRSARLCALVISRPWSVPALVRLKLGTAAARRALPPVLRSLVERAP